MLRFDSAIDKTTTVLLLLLLLDFKGLKQNVLLEEVVHCRKCELVEIIATRVTQDICDGWFVSTQEESSYSFFLSYLFLLDFLPYLYFSIYHFILFFGTHLKIKIHIFPKHKFLMHNYTFKAYIGKIWNWPFILS